MTDRERRRQEREAWAEDQLREGLLAREPDTWRAFVEGEECVPYVSRYQVRHEWMWGFVQGFRGIEYPHTYFTAEDDMTMIRGYRAGRRVREWTGINVASTRWMWFCLWREAGCRHLTRVKQHGQDDRGDMLAAWVSRCRAEWIEGQEERP